MTPPRAHARSKMKAGSRTSFIPVLHASMASGSLSSLCCNVRPRATSQPGQGYRARARVRVRIRVRVSQG